MEKFLDKISKTGGTNHDFLFTHLEISEDELNQVENNDVEQLANQLNVDYISVIKTGTIEFIHITYEENYESIHLNGLIRNNDDWVMDLGKGIYVIENGNEEALDNLKDYVMNEDYEALIVKGSYSGTYKECVYGEQHEGYIVLITEKVISDAITDMEKVSIDDFLMY